MDASSDFTSDITYSADQTMADVEAHEVGKVASASSDDGDVSGLGGDGDACGLVESKVDRKPPDFDLTDAEWNEIQQDYEQETGRLPGAEKRRFVNAVVFKRMTGRSLANLPERYQVNAQLRKEHARLSEKRYVFWEKAIAQRVDVMKNKKQENYRFTKNLETIRRLAPEMLPHFDDILAAFAESCERRETAGNTQSVGSVD